MPGLANSSSAAQAPAEHETKQAAQVLPPLSAQQLLENFKSQRQAIKEAIEIKKQEVLLYLIGKTSQYPDSLAELMLLASAFECADLAINTAPPEANNTEALPVVYRDVINSRRPAPVAAEPVGGGAAAAVQQPEPANQQRNTLN